MEKLILRSIMYGADKIPDSWFEKVPGGYYKTKDGRTVAAGSGSASAGNSRPGTSEEKGGGIGRSRRHSTGEATRGQPPDADMDAGYRSSGGGSRRHREHRRQERSSYDGMEDDEGSYTGDDRRRRRNHSSSRRRHRSFEDEDRGYEHGYGEPPYDDRQDNRRVNGYGAAPYPERDFGPKPRSHPSGMAGAAAMGAAAGAAAAQEPPYSPSEARSPELNSPQPRQTNTTRPNFSNGYVPYADVYGSNDRQAPAQTFSPAPQSTFNGSVQPNETNRVMHPVAPPPGHYQQNAYAQDGATAPVNGAGAPYGGQSAFYPQEYDTSYDPRYVDRREDDRYNGYDDHRRPDSPPSRRDSHRRRGEEGSQDYDSYSPPRKPDHRSRGHDRRPEEDLQRSKSQGGRQGKSNQLQQNLKDRFDTSQRGLGYSAVGAIAGGLAGSELAKGPLGIGLGAVVGALGANAYEARERYVPSQLSPTGAPQHHHQQQRQPSMMAVDPRRPLGAQWRGGDGAVGEKMRRKDDRRPSQYARDDRREGGRGRSGYYSD